MGGVIKQSEKERKLVNDSIMEVLNESGHERTSRTSCSSTKSDCFQSKTLANKRAPGVSTSPVRVENPLEEEKEKAPLPKRATTKWCNSGHVDQSNFTYYRIRRFNNQTKHNNDKQTPSTV